ncbi:MAG: efflux transporter outer membrane subunit, partial [Gammaproteobacteria bacterium]|nr:efflux transporter outer membrane subunit [Gammaproteobacteria bacterium]
MRHGVITLLVFGSLQGCMVGPDYRTPDPVLPDRWQAARSKDLGLKPISQSQLKDWWKTFDDPLLDQLIARAQQGNLDLKMAFTRIEQARAERLANRADLFPKVGALAIPAHFDNLIPGSGQRGSAGGTNFFLAGFDALWEVDVFGRLRRKLEAASAVTEGAQEDYREAWVMVTSEVARTYTEYRNFQHQIRITTANLESQRHTLKLTEQLYQEGVGTRYDVARAKAQTETTSAMLPAINGQLIAAQHRLELLIGEKPGALQVKLSAPQKLPQTATRNLLTRPADTLRYRPDIRGAEKDLEAATATQGAAFAELFPKISIAAFAGLQNSDLENLFRSSAFSWASGSAIMQPIFNFGRIRAGIDLADARQKEAYLHYEKTVLEALGEAETAMTRFLQEEERRQQLKGAIKDLRESHRLAELRYREGISTFLDVLDAERILYQEELSLAQSEAQATIYQIALYKALGGSGQLEV